MTKPVVPRALARQDVDSAVDHYLGESKEAALGFIEALEQAWAHIGRHPASGSPRYAHELDLPELRSWTLKDYPYVVLYVEKRDRIEVWRVLHGARDIPGSLRNLDPRMANDV